MTSPAYFLAARIIQDAGYGDRMYAVEEASPSHLDLDLLETRLRELRDDDLQNSGVPAHLPGKRFRNVLYGVPTFSNPSGSTWTPATRQRVLDLARQYDMLIVTDEVYDLLSYDHPPESDPLRMVDLDHGPDAAGGVGFGNCVSNFSFSKYLGPGIRCGFIQASSAAMAAQWAAGGANHSGGATAQMTSYFIERIVASGELDNVITRLCREYADRSRVIRDALQKDLPRGSTIAGGHGGYFIWVTLPGDGRYKHTEEIAKVAAGEPYNVLALAGKNFQVPSGGNELEPDWVKRTLRLSLSWETSSQISQGVRRLCKVIADSELNPEMTR
ncbi:Valine--pyruvate aminotransferase [Savitreella phatthalungensis]